MKLRFCRKAQNPHPIQVLLLYLQTLRDSFLSHNFCDTSADASPSFDVCSRLCTPLEKSSSSSRAMSLRLRRRSDEHARSRTDLASGSLHCVKHAFHQSHSQTSRLMKILEINAFCKEEQKKLFDFWKETQKN